jgi:hypothetical protein
VYVPTVLLPVLVVALVGACSFWVLRDAQSRTEGGRTVVAVLWGYTIEDPATWAVLCLMACIIFVPIYLRARGDGS